MPLLYSVISRGNTILAKYAECVGNFAEVTEQIINKISSDNHKLTYSHGNYLIHYISYEGIIYMCITDDVGFHANNFEIIRKKFIVFYYFQEFERSRAFLFLTEIKNRFIELYGLTIAVAIAYGMNTEFSKILSAQMKTYNEARNMDTISRVHGQIDELKDIMVKNIENVTARGERLELLVNKTENLRDTVSHLCIFYFCLASLILYL